MLNDRQKILLELCCAGMSSGKCTFKDIWDSIGIENSYLEKIAKYIQAEEDKKEECLDKEDKKPIINYSY